MCFNNDIGAAGIKTIERCRFCLLFYIISVLIT